MAYAYGNTIRSTWHAQFEYYVSETSTTYSLAVGSLGAYATGSNSLGGLRNSTLTVSGTDQATISKSQADSEASIPPTVWTWNKGTSDASKTISFSDKITYNIFNSNWDKIGGPYTDTSSGSFAITVPALANYKVSYNANGGTGAPAAQTKYYGSDITLSSATPTRSSYRFVSWNTKADGTGTSYAPGATYSANQSINLYAIWKFSYSGSIGTITAYRCDADGTQNDIGEYGKVETSFTLSGEDAVSGTLTISYEPQSTSPSSPTVVGTFNNTKSAGVPSATKNVATKVFGPVDTDISYNVIASLTYAGVGTTTKSTTITKAEFVIDFRAGGKGVAIGAASTREGFEVAWDAYLKSLELDECLPIESGGTGATTAVDARANLGFDIQTYDVKSKITASGATVNTAVLTVYGGRFASLNVTHKYKEAHNMNTGSFNLYTLAADIRPSVTSSATLWDRGIGILYPDGVAQGYNHDNIGSGWDGSFMCTYILANEYFG